MEHCDTKTLGPRERERERERKAEKLNKKEQTKEENAEGYPDGEGEASDSSHGGSVRRETATERDQNI